jgi:menaquinone-dependent protoporphyrinogen IX oxidase
MKGLIVFKGKYGATAQYAEWLGVALDIPVMEAEEVTAEIINDHDYVVVGSSVYVGKLRLRSWLAQFTPSLASRKTFFLRI